MRDALGNPFSPGADTIPEVWAGRTAQLSDWRDVVRPRRLAGLAERARIILGEPGLGKSALVRRISRDAKRAGDWVTPQVRIPAGADPMKLVADAVLGLAADAGLPTSREKRISDAIARVQAVAASGLSVTLRGSDSPEPHKALTALLVEVGKAAIARGDVVILIHIDEVQNIGSTDALSQLLIALGDALTYEVEVEVPGGAFVQRSLPLAVYLTGLPEFEETAVARKGATFARRFKTTALAPIESDDLAEALQPLVVNGWEFVSEAGDVLRVRVEQDAAAKIVELCCGEPFLFQLAGEQAWYAGDDDAITVEDVIRGWRSVRREATVHVDRVLDRLPARERQLLEVMADLPPTRRSLTQIAHGMGYAKPTEAATTAQRLDIVRGILERGKQYKFRHRAVEARLTTDWPNV